MRFHEIFCKVQLLLTNYVVRTHASQPQPKERKQRKHFSAFCVESPALLSWLRLTHSAHLKYPSQLWLAAGSKVSWHQFQMRSWFVKSWKLKNVFEIPTNWQFRNQDRKVKTFRDINKKIKRREHSQYLFSRILIFRAKLYYSNSNCFRWIFIFCQINVAKLNEKVIRTNLWWIQCWISRKDQNRKTQFSC